MEIRLLGPVRMFAQDREWVLVRSHRRCLLAALALTPGKPVPVDTLVDRIWGDRPPDAARRSLYSHVSVLRRKLSELDAGTGTVALHSHEGSYQLEIDPHRVDIHRCRHWLTRVRQLEAGQDPADREAVRLLREAHALWRGRPLACLKGEWATRTREGLEQEGLTVALERFRFEVRRGEHAGAVAPLTELVSEHPLVEPLAELLMVALYRSGRRSDALEVYARTRRRLVEQLGDEPGSELRALHQQILRRDSRLAIPADAGPARAGGTDTTVGADSHASVASENGGGAPGLDSPTVRPAQLPPDIAGFTGRAGQLAQLDSLLTPARAHPHKVSLATIVGTPGIGKTALAVHWAHRIAGEFPDGQLYVNLRGFEPRGRPMPPPEAARRFIQALTGRVEPIPTDAATRLDLYRSLLADRRVLVVLDNARDADQIRPLIPGASGCMAVVTSRRRLSGLVARDGAVPIPLDRLSDQDAQRLLTARLGADRVSEEPAAVRALISACGGLPLALVIAVARALTHPHFPLTLLAGEVREAGAGLEPWAGSDSATDLRAVFSPSYQALDPASARLFRLLGRHPGREVAVPSAARIAQIPPATARQLLRSLTDAHLLAEPVPGRYILHRLLQAYAAELCGTVDPEPFSDQERA